MHDNIIVKEKVSAPVDKVWEAITDRSKMKEWYFDIPDFELEENREFSFYGSENNDRHHHHAEILEVVPKQKLKMSWSYPEITKEKTIVKWELQPVENGTEITLTHKGLENLEHLGKDFSRNTITETWNDIVGKSLKNYVEN